MNDGCNQFCNRLCKSLRRHGFKKRWQSLGESATEAGQGIAL